MQWNCISLITAWEEFVFLDISPGSISFIGISFTDVFITESADTYTSVVDIRTSESSDPLNMELLAIWDECAQTNVYEEYAAGLCTITRPARSVAIMATQKTFIIFCEIQVLGHLVGATTR